MYLTTPSGFLLSCPLSITICANGKARETEPYQTVNRPQPPWGPLGELQNVFVPPFTKLTKWEVCIACCAGTLSHSAHQQSTQLLSFGCSVSVKGHSNTIASQQCPRVTLTVSPSPRARKHVSEVKSLVRCPGGALSCQQPGTMSGSECSLSATDGTVTRCGWERWRMWQEMSSLVGGKAFRARPSRINFYSLPGSICSVHSLPITTVATEGMVMTILPLLTIRQINC